MNKSRIHGRSFIHWYLHILALKDLVRYIRKAFDNIIAGAIITIGRVIAFHLHFARIEKNIAKRCRDYNLCQVERNSWINSRLFEEYFETLQVCIDVKPQHEEHDKDAEHQDYSQLNLVIKILEVKLEEGHENDEKRDEREGHNRVKSEYDPVKDTIRSWKKFELTLRLIRNHFPWGDIGQFEVKCWLLDWI